MDDCHFIAVPFGDEASDVVVILAASKRNEHTRSISLAKAVQRRLKQFGVRQISRLEIDDAQFRRPEKLRRIRESAGQFGETQ